MVVTAPKMSDFDWSNDWVGAYRAAVSIDGGVTWHRALRDSDDKWYVSSRLHPDQWVDADPFPINTMSVYFETVRAKVYDPVSPSHYKFPGGVEAIDLAKHLSFSLGSAVKYCARAGRKPGADAVEDLRKAENFIRIEIERLEQVSDR